MPGQHAAAFGQLTIVVQDMDATLAFYRRLGLAIEAEPGSPHVAVELPGGFLVEFDQVDLVARWDSGSSGSIGEGTILGFWLPSRHAVDEVYSDLVGAGHAGHQPPYDAFWGGRYAIVDDPSGHAVGLMSPTDENHRYWPPTPPPSRSPRGIPRRAADRGVASPCCDHAPAEALDCTPLALRRVAPWRPATEPARKPVGGPRRPQLLSRRPCERSRRWYP